MNFVLHCYNLRVQPKPKSALAISKSFKSRPLIQDFKPSRVQACRRFEATSYAKPALTVHCEVYNYESNPNEIGEDPSPRKRLAIERPIQALYRSLASKRRSHSVCSMPDTECIFFLISVSELRFGSLKSFSFSKKKTVYARDPARLHTER